MYYRIISVVFIAFVMALNSLVVNGQSTDSLLYKLNNNLFRNDTDKYEILCDLAETSKDADSKIKYSEKAIELAEKLNMLAARPTVLKGFGYLNSGQLALAHECFITAANYYRAKHSNKGLAAAYLNISEAYNQIGGYTNAIYYHKKAIEIYKKENDSITLAEALLNLGYVKYKMGQNDTALILYSEANEIYPKKDSPFFYAYYLGNSGLVYYRLSDFGKSEAYLLRAVDILTRMDDERAVTEYMIAYAGILQHKGEIKEAIDCAKKSYGSAVKNNIKEYERDAAYRLAQLYKVTGRYDSAYQYLSFYIIANDSIKSNANIQKMADQRTAFEVAAIQAQVKLSEQKRFILRIVTFGLAVILLLAVGLIVLYYYSLKRSKMLTAELDERRKLLEKQSTELLKQNDKIIKANEELKQLYEITNNQKEEIISSINYAQRIQTAVLPPETYITELINENFILYKPKEIVSGDFYWIKQLNHYIILAAADCTGHGVPGAFMSMLGISSLNEVVQRMESPQANQILNELRKEIKHSLRQTGKKDESRDGIDMALCIIDTRSSIIQYSGANNPLYIISNSGGEEAFKEIKADSMPVGVHFSGDKSFTNHEIQLEIGDTFYIFTDGYIDQIGGSANSRFSSKKFKKLLLQIHGQPLFEQKEILEQTLKEWMGDQPQRDDILVIGARV
jgi:serine phosphatase RsbU (regulator of sigma subunit)